MATDLGTTTESKLTVLLDTNVIITYLRRKPELAKLFSPEIEANVQYAINPVVLQELLLVGTPFPERFENEGLAEKLVMLPVDEAGSRELVGKLKSFRNKLAHANSYLILGSSKECDFILSYDVNMHDLSQAADVKVLDPEEFLAQMGVA